MNQINKTMNVEEICENLYTDKFNNKFVDISTTDLKIYFEMLVIVTFKGFIKLIIILTKLVLI